MGKWKIQTGRRREQELLAEVGLPGDDGRNAFEKKEIEFLKVYLPIAEERANNEIYFLEKIDWLLVIWIEAKPDTEELNRIRTYLLELLLSPDFEGIRLFGFWISENGMLK